MMKLNTQHIHLIILLAFLACLPKWGTAQTLWCGNAASDGAIGSGTFSFYDAPGTTGNKFTCSYAYDGHTERVYDGIGNVEKVTAGATATIDIQTTHPIDLFGTFTVTAGTLVIQLNGQILSKVTAGRVAVVNGGTLTIRDAAPTVSHMGRLISETITNGTYSYTYNNIWQSDASGTVEIKGGIITGGRSAVSNNGGCVFVNPGGTLSIEGGTLAGNVSGFNGGAVYLVGSKNDQTNVVTKATLQMSGGSICYNAGVSGGGVCALNYTTFTMTGGSINYNVARDWGLHNGGNGGAVYCGTSGVSIAVKKGNFIGNKALKNSVNSGGTGGAFSLNASGITAVFGETGAVLIQNNESESHGGGFCAEGSTAMTFMNGNVTIDSNVAGGDGGGVCCGNVTGESPYTRLKIYGATITNNKAGSGKHGGGIYDRGTYINFGGTAAIIVKGNTAGDVANDINLTLGTITIENNTINPKDVGIYLSGSENNLGFFYSGSGTSILSNVYTNITNGTCNVFCNRTEYWKIKEYPAGDEHNIFFTKSVSPWSAEQQTTTTSDLHLNNGYYEISSVKELTAFLWHVNGITTHGAFGSGDLTANGKLTADINMSGQYWLPIADGYTGIFDGNGHSISNLTMERENPSSERGMFGRIDAGAEIKNLQLHGCSFVLGGAVYVGCIASKLNGGTIYNCVADGTLTASSSPAVMGGLVGKQTSGTIHSSFATATLTGYQMGGLVGEIASGSNLKNSFANASITPLTGSTDFTGGLVGVNGGQVENCYARVRGTVPATTYFGYLAGSNSIESTNGTLQYCYSPASPHVSSNGTAGTQTGLGTYGTTSLVNDKYGYLQADQQISPTNGHVVNGAFSSTNGLTGLLYALNHWANSAEGGAQYARWMRTSASPINGDYPIFNYDNYVCVGSTDNIALEYRNDFSTLFTSYVGSGASGVGTIYLYKNPGATTIAVSNSGKATELYIHEDVVLLHTSTINAHVGITLDNSAGIAGGGANPTFGGSDLIDWHFFSSSLSNAPIGLSYPAATPSYNTEPGQATFTASNAANGYFPTNLDSYYTEWDLYGYCEPDYHWINYKRNSDNHWHEDWPDCPITYTNHTTFQPGYGYMVALAREGYLQGYGTLNTNTGTAPDVIKVPVTYTSDISWTGRQGLNLLGNPYQSYLDFNVFASINSSLWNGTTPFYIIMDEDQSGYVTYSTTQSANVARASRYLHPHQGFMIKVDESSTPSTPRTAQFHNGMRTVTMETGWTSSGFRGEGQPNYALVNLFTKDPNGNRDLVTVELGRPEIGGLAKASVPGVSMGHISCRYEGEDYDLAYTLPGLDVANIHFATDEDAEYTMTWNTQNGEFSYLHLIDNMTGIDIDCLTTEEYRFSSQTSDYASRFRLVFGYTGIEEPEEGGPSTSSGTFAFMMGNELVVNGEGRLEVVDIMGRIVKTEELSGVQSTVHMPRVSAGVYVLRLSGANGTKTQKIIIG